MGGYFLFLFISFHLIRKEREPAKMSPIPKKRAKLKSKAFLYQVIYFHRYIYKNATQLNFELLRGIVMILDKEL